jgi:hypothetical protein
VLLIRDVYPGSRILIFTHPRSRFLPIPDRRSRISDPGSWIQKPQEKRGVKKFFCHTFLCSHKFHKIVNYFSFEVLKKKIRANFQRIIELCTQQIATKLSKIWVWDRDQRSWIRKKPIPDPGSRGSKKNWIPDPGSGSATLVISRKTFFLNSFLLAS